HGEREMARLRWGLVPRWAKDPSIGSRMINARCETLADKPAYRNAFQRHRCLILADAFFEWKTTLRGKQQMPVQLRNGKQFCKDGLYELWLLTESEDLDTCKIVTPRSNPLMRDMHERMPVIDPHEHYARWLDAANREVNDLFEQFAPDAMA